MLFNAIFQSQQNNRQYGILDQKPLRGKNNSWQFSPKMDKLTYLIIELSISDILRTFLCDLFHTECLLAATIALQHNRFWIVWFYNSLGLTFVKSLKKCKMS